ncbi:MAG: galactofuranose ABC transporter, permease protein YjfF [Gaiellaceae bacterium]
MSTPEFASRPLEVLGAPFRRIPVKAVPVIASFGLFVLMFTFGSIRYPDFGNTQVLLNLFIDNSYLLPVAVGMTFVILSGGIDLSVGSAVSLSTLICAELSVHGWSPYLAWLAALAVGTALGFAMGCLIHYFDIQPFIVTLAGLFLARGLCYAITTDAISIQQSTYVNIAEWQVNVHGLYLSAGALVALSTVVIGVFLLHFTRLGRTAYAMGNDFGRGAQSALLMGLPVARTRISVYTISGFCSALGGILLSFYMLSGSGSLAVGLELQAIAAVVVGGTLLTGGTGYVLGTVIGVMVLGLIQTLINFQGTLSTWWVKMATGALVFAFIVLQRLVFRAQRR